MSDRCTGHCCEQFLLPASPEELQAHYMEWLKDTGGRSRENMFGLDGGLRPVPNKIQDIHLIYPMVVYLGKMKNQVEAVDPEYVPTDDGHYYTCKHFDRETRNCGIYDIRPSMCSNYPYSSSCNYAACTWEERKRRPRASLPVLQESPADKVIAEMGSVASSLFSEAIKASEK